MAGLQGAASADLLGLGEHCGVPECRQIDFLPFSCDCCNKTFCLDHRTYSAHQCQASGFKQCEVIVCPLCAKGVRLEAGVDPNVAFETHTRSGCDPTNYNKVHNKPRCPVPNCREKLSLTNAYRCKECSQRVCLKHRHGDDHNCAAAKASLANKAVAKHAPAAPAAPARAPSPAAPKPTPQQAYEAARKQYQDPANSIQGTAERRQQQPPAAPRPASGQQRQTTSNANPLVPPHLPEECPQCHARFATVERLIQHVDDFHPASASSAGAAAAPRSYQAQQGQGQQHQRGGGAAGPGAGSGAAGGAGTRVWPGEARGARGTAAAAAAAGASGSSSEQFVCPRCAAVFFNPVRLVQHTESCTGAQQSQAAGGGDKCTIS